MKAASLVAVTVVCAAFAASPAAAQLGSGASPVRSDAGGLGVGVQLNRVQVSSQGRMVPGAGLGLAVSYGMSDALSGFARANYGYRTAQVDLGARYRFGSAAGALRPYVEGAVTRLGAIRSTPESESLRSWGLGMTVGAGAEYYFNPRFALDLGLAHSRGRFSEPAVQAGEAAFREKFSSTRLQMGFTWRP